MCEAWIALPVKNCFAAISLSLCMRYNWERSKLSAGPEEVHKNSAPETGPAATALHLHLLVCRYAANHDRRSHHTSKLKHIVVDKHQRIGQLLKDLQRIGELRPKVPRVAASCHIYDSLANLNTMCNLKT